MKKFIPLVLLLTTISLMATGIVVVLFQMGHHRQTAVGDFYRSFPPHFFNRSTIIDIGTENYFIMGIHTGRCYLQMRGEVDGMLVLNITSKEMKRQHIELPDSSRFAWGARKVVINGNQIWYVEGVSPSILSGSFPILEMHKTNIDHFQFDDCWPLSENSYVIRTYDRVLQQHVLAKSTIQPVQTKMAASILKKQVDGIFCTDGKFCYDPDSQKGVYVYYFRNQLTCMDSNLQVLYIVTTLDTNTTAKIKVGEARNGAISTRMLAAPPLLVNKTAFAGHGHLFVESMINARNEATAPLSFNSRLDIYSLRDGHYRYSCYVPAYEGEQARDMRLEGRQLVALYRQHLVIYDISADYLTDN